MLKPRALRPGDRIAVVAPASPFRTEDFHAGVAELRTLGFEPCYDERVFERSGFLAGAAALRASALRDALDDASVGAIIAVRGGYGSVETLPLLDPAHVAAARKPIIGYSDVTSLLTFVTLQCGLVAFHGPTVAGRLGRGQAAYDRRSLLAALCDASPLGPMRSPSTETLRPGSATGPLFGGTLTQLAASLGTPFGFTPPEGHVLLVDEVNERPYRLHRMLTQLRLAGVLDRAAAVVLGELPGCDEPGGQPTARDAVLDALATFDGPVLFGFSTGHSAHPALTLPLGVRTRVEATAEAPRLVVEEPAVDAA